MPKRKDNPFFCYKKDCRKTAWDTPEYLSDTDWLNLKKLIKIVQEQNIDDFYHFVCNDSGAKDFFYHVLGWPEGNNYCIFNYNYCKYSALPGIKQNNLKQMKAALEKHLDSIF